MAQSVKIADEDSDEAESLASRTFLGAQAGLQLSLGANLRWVNRLTVLTSEYAEESALSNTNVNLQEEREDTFLSVASQINWSFSDNFSLRGQIRYTDNNSNIDVFEYDGVSGDVRIRYDFN